MTSTGPLQPETAIGGGGLLLVLLVVYILSRIKVAGPNEAFIVTGRKGRFKAVVSGRNGAGSAEVPPNESPDS